MSDLEKVLDFYEGLEPVSLDFEAMVDAARRFANLTSPETIEKAAIVIHNWPWGPDHPPFYECLCLKRAEVLLRSVEEGKT